MKKLVKFIKNQIKNIRKRNNKEKNTNIKIRLKQKE